MAEPGRGGRPISPDSWPSPWLQLIRERRWKPSALAADLGSPYSTCYSWARGVVTIPREKLEALCGLAFACKVPIPADGWRWLMERAELHDLTALAARLRRRIPEA